MDVWSQIMQLGDDFATKHYRQPTKITVDQGISDWMTDYLRRMQPDAPSDAAISLLGVPIIVDDEFYRGQFRVHYGDGEFEDHLVILPVEYPRWEARGGRRAAPWRPGSVWSSLLASTHTRTSPFTARMASQLPGSRSASSRV